MASIHRADCGTLQSHLDKVLITHQQLIIVGIPNAQRYDHRYA